MCVSRADTVTDCGVTYGALILFGTKKAVQKLLPRSEVIFEYQRMLTMFHKIGDGKLEKLGDRRVNALRIALALIDKELGGT